MASEIGKLVDYLRARNLSFYHFTDSRNLESVKDRGLLSLRLLKEGGIDFVPGGNDWSHEADAYKGVDRHVHLSFTSNHPMEFVATREKRIEKSVVLKVRPEIIATAGAQISLGVANASGASDRLSLIDFAASL